MLHSVRKVSQSLHHLISGVAGNSLIARARSTDQDARPLPPPCPHVRQGLSPGTAGSPHTVPQVLSLFLALLLSSFGASNLSAVPTSSGDTNKLAEAFDRIGRFKRWVKTSVLNGLKALRAKLTNQISDQSRGGFQRQMQQRH